MKAKIKHKFKTGIYLIFNTVNGKVYVGKAKCIYGRIVSHISSLNKRNKKQENEHFINAWHKHGGINFNYLVLEYCSLEELAEKELYYIDLFKSLNAKIGYNKRYDSSTGMVVSEETRNKMRISRYKALKDPLIKAKCSHTYWKDNPEALKEMSKQITLLNTKYNIVKLDYHTLQLIEVYLNWGELKVKEPLYYIQAIKGCCSGSKLSYKGFKWGYIEIATGELIYNKPKAKYWKSCNKIINKIGI